MIPRERPKPEPKATPVPPDPALAPPPETVDVVDYTFATTAGQVVIRVTAADQFAESEAAFVVHKAAEIVTIFKASVAWWSRYPRTVVLPPKSFAPSHGSAG